MAYNRTLTQLISDVRIRTSTGGAVARHPDSVVLRFLVESLQSLRALLTDAGSTRWVTRVTVANYYFSQDIPGAIGIQLVDSPGSGALARTVESVTSIHYPSQGQHVELRRVSLPELVALSTSGARASRPAVWADAGTSEVSQPNPSGFEPGARLIYLAPWAGGYGTSPFGGSLIVLGTYGMEDVTAVTDVSLEQYGFEWLIADASLKIATRDNDSMETAQLLMAAKQEAEKRMLSTIARERTPQTQRRVAASIRARGVPWQI